MFASRRLLFLIIATLACWFCGVSNGALPGNSFVDAVHLERFDGEQLSTAGGSAEANAGSSTDTADFDTLAEYRLQAESRVVINELHVDPDVKTELVEFVELCNPTSSEVDLTGWQFTSGISYTFPAGAKMPAGGYIIVAQDPNHIHAKWSSGRFGIRANLVFGPYGGKLDNEGDRIVLVDADGLVVDEVEYRLGFPWPTVGDAVPAEQPGTGRSMQLTNPLFDNDLGSLR